MKNIGRNSLYISVLGLILFYSLIELKIVSGWEWHILLAGFEAATVGGIADWFAVTALFKEIPLPLVKKHTNIIVKNRAKMSLGIVDLVTNKWLSPETIKDKISNLSITSNILSALEDPGTKNKVIDFVRFILKRMTENLDKPELSNFLQNYLKEELSGIDFSSLLGKWLERSIRNGDHVDFWEVILDSAHHTINDDTTRNSIRELISKTIQSYKSDGFFKKAFMNLAMFSRALDEDLLADKIIDELNDFIAEAKNNPTHKIRMRLDEYILQFAENLSNGDTSAKKIIDDFQKKFVENLESHDLIHTTLIKFKNRFFKELESNDTPLMIMIEKYMTDLIQELKGDLDTQNNIDSWAKETILIMVTKYHPEIGAMVSESLKKLSDVELVSQIEEKVGNDLQYIRLNGAIIGGFTGMGIAVIKYVIKFA